MSEARTKKEQSIGSYSKRKERENNLKTSSMIAYCAGKEKEDTTEKNNTGCSQVKEILGTNSFLDSLHFRNQ